VVRRARPLARRLRRPRRRPRRANLPLLDEPKHPRLRQYIHQYTKDSSAIVDAGDAFVFVTPEYIRYPAALKNAIDYLQQEWRDKPVGFVSYGGVSAGMRAVQQLKQVLKTLKMLPVFEAVSIPFHPQFIGEDGRVQANDHHGAGRRLDARRARARRRGPAPAARAQRPGSLTVDGGAGWPDHPEPPRLLSGLRQGSAHTAGAHRIGR
jgi:NAD(P)H-dependent FMN reductase